MTSKPSESTSSMPRAASATAFDTTPSAFTCAKSRTRRSSRFAMRGVPRERLAISVAPAAASSTPISPAERCTMRARSSTP